MYLEDAENLNAAIRYPALRCSVCTSAGFMSACMFPYVSLSIYGCFLVSLSIISPSHRAVHFKDTDVLLILSVHRVSHSVEVFNHSFILSASLSCCQACSLNSSSSPHLHSSAFQRSLPVPSLPSFSTRVWDLAPAAPCAVFACLVLANL